ncbi:hypothetical protein LOAG_14612, partial [Loa loa]
MTYHFKPLQQSIAAKVRIGIKNIEANIIPVVVTVVNYLTTGQMRIKCRYCNVTVQTRKEYSKHLEMHEKYNFTCPECGKTFYSLRRFREHKEVHQPKHQCAMCNRSFSYKTGLRQHQRQFHRGSEVAIQKSKVFILFIQLREVENKSSNLSKIEAVLARTKKFATTITTVILVPSD